MDLQTLAASVTASVSSRLVVFPLDTIAIQRQTAMRRPLFPADQTLLRSFRNLYRGLSVSLILTTPAVALYLCTYRQLKQMLIPTLGEGNMNYIVSGTGAEIVSSFLWTPLEVLKARLQISGAPVAGLASSNTTLMGQLRLIARDEGMRGFYRGYLVGLGIFIPYNAVYWVVYENSKRLARRSMYFQEPFAQAALASGVATSVSTLLAHPLDLIKTRYQVSMSDAVQQTATQQQTRKSDRLGVRQVLRNVMQESGWRGLYAGLGPRLFCSIPSSVLSMSVFEFFANAI
ncbi:hypothetical protein BCR37DRAFT_402643 [Protomyces lactucae-debilis]|uniref:Mitochondrial carrier domain-containing protein n=1 Tax=Protomyces lactucae-debilis TaxID=2754530 RepID=A0A1Y2FGZ3_PROLT|nr:uncharacterized protein BCR37DRAFT_402643 [Protomyces lactucae-debilis]ORY82546.1 hypothetical protein BCR37DRAFT_402643 [Protomyces lactucae-debilis]